MKESKVGQRRSRRHGSHKHNFGERFSDTIRNYGLLVWAMSICVEEDLNNGHVMVDVGTHFSYYSRRHVGLGIGCIWGTASVVLRHDMHVLLYLLDNCGTDAKDMGTLRTEDEDEDED